MNILDNISKLNVKWVRFLGVAPVQTCSLCGMIVILVACIALMLILLSEYVH